MPLQAPPGWIADGVERASPGFWGSFQRAGSLAWSRGGPMQVTSWWRSRSFNAEVGGSDFSQHLVGAAFDLIARDYNAAGRAFRAQGFATVFEGDHLHVQAWPAGAARGLISHLGV